MFFRALAQSLVFLFVALGSRLKLGSTQLRFNGTLIQLGFLLCRVVYIVVGAGERLAEAVYRIASVDIE